MLTNEELIQESPKFLQKVVDIIIDYPYYNIQVPNVITPGNLVVALAKELKNALSKNKEIAESLSRSIVDKINNILQEVKFKKRSSKERMWSEILKLMLKDEHVVEFTSLIETLSTKYKQSVIESFYSFLVEKLVF